MPRRSKVLRLPPPIREAIADLREAGFTIDEILDHLKRLAEGQRETLPPELRQLPDVDPDALPSRSGLARHIKGLEELADRIHRSRAVADALVKRLGEAPENRQARLNIELMHSIVTDLVIAAEDGGEVKLDPEQVMFLSTTLRNLSQAAKADVDRTVKIEEKVRAEEAKRLEESVAQAAAAAEGGKLTAQQALERVRAIYRGEA